MIAPRYVAPLVACGIAFGAAVVGGACVLPSASNPPTLQTGIYTLTLANGQSPPATFVDSAGRTLRVVADTFNLTATQFYDERAAVAITLPGGTQGPVGPFAVTHQTYVRPSNGTVTFITTLYGGSIRATVMTPTSFYLQMPDHSTWTYEKR
jgi:hypothetical protein